jgi:peptidoglycan/xylan/chitin deacetylase (PgdA/CDA1 family)
MSMEWSPYLDWLIAAATGGAASAAIGWTSVAPTSEFWGKVIAHGPPDQPAVALTFDDGPTPGATDQILDILADLKTPAVFFVIGANVQQSPDLLKRIHDQGHIVANHTWDHSHLGCLRGPRYWFDQIERTSDLVEQTIGHRPAFFRPPLGIRTPFVTAAARRAGLRLITWSRRGMDGVETTPARICQRLGPATGAGEILILHDGVEPNSRRDPTATVAALGPLIDTLRYRGLELIRLDKLIGVQPYLEKEAPACSGSSY